MDNLIKYQELFDTDLIICQGFFSNEITDILKKEVEKRKNTVDIFNIFYTNKKYLPIENEKEYRIIIENNEHEFSI